MVNPVFKAVDNYISFLLIQEDEVLLSVPETLKAANLPFSSVSPNQGRFLQIMALACGAKRILELSTLGGYSAIWLARALTETAKMITVKTGPVRAAVAKENIDRAGLSGKVDIRIGKTMDVLQQLQQNKTEPFDLVFIDVDKELYAEYFELASVQINRN